jgi:hypothetical protein
MAYDFVPGSLQSIDASSAVVTAMPLTICALANIDDASTRGVLVAVTRSNGQFDHWVLSAPSFITPNRVEIVSQTNGQFDAVVATTNFSTNTWLHAAGIFASSTSRSVFFDGGSKASSSVTSTPVSINATSIGRLWRTGASNAYADGRIAEVGIWNATLTDEEIASLAKGFKPYRIRPQSLRFYAPLIRNVQDVRQGRALTNNNGATVARHPRVY